MFPYIEHPSLDVGFYELQAFPILAGLAIVVQFQLVAQRAPSRGFDRWTTSVLLGWAIFLGLVGAHVFDLVAYYPEKLVRQPLELFRIWSSLSSFGGIVGGLLGLYVVMKRKGMSAADMTRFVDCLIFALPFTLALGRAGCALQHDHIGIASSHWLAVRFPDGPRFDLGLLECLYMVAMAGVFLALDRRRRPDGFFIGLFFALYGPVRFSLDVLRTGDARYLGWTPGQYLSLLATLVGLAILGLGLARRRQLPA